MMEALLANSMAGMISAGSRFHRSPGFPPTSHSSTSNSDSLATILILHDVPADGF